MRALLSLCNQPRTPERGALLFDFDSKTGSWIGVGTDAEIMGTRGMCMAGNMLYVAYTVGWYETHVSTYSLAQSVPRFIDDRLLPEVRDPHSMCVHDERLLVASTGTDEIIAYDLDSGEITDLAETLWRAGETAADTHHVNSVYSDGTRVVVSAFGPRAGEFWSSAEQGYVYDVTAGERLCGDLHHPHSVRMHHGRIYFAESARQTLRVIGETPIVIGGYVRGCDVADDSTVFVGSNAARRVSRSHGVVTNSNNPENTEGDTVGKCSVARVRRNGTPMREYFDITPYGNEIYDICVLDNPSAGNN